MRRRETGRARGIIEHDRDQGHSAFTAILAELVSRIPGAFAAAVVDADGETVDYYGRADPFEVRIAAAHWRIVLGQIASTSLLGRTRSVLVRGTRKSFILCPLPDAYALVVVLRRRAGFTASSRALICCERALCREAGWHPRAAATSLEHWFPVSVECDRRRRPKRVRAQETAASAGVPHGVEVLGAVMGLRMREAGFRVRLDSGVELTLVRESGGFWYTDDPIDAHDEQSR